MITVVTITALSPVPVVVSLTTRAVLAVLSTLNVVLRISDSVPLLS